jgi:branched-chain amino acid transport system ATP-binding protein
MALRSKGRHKAEDSTEEVASAPSNGSGNGALLQVEGLKVGYGSLPVLYGIDMSVDEGETAVVLGLNGAGKTTTVLTLAGMMRPWSGSITYAGEDVSKTPVETMVKKGVVLVPEGRRVFPNLPVEENLRVGAWVKRHDKDFIETQIERCYRYFPRLQERRDQIAGTLSGGEQQMLAISRGLMAGPKLLMIDEASLGLAPVIVQQVLEVVREINEDGVTVILNEQNVGSLRLADKAFVIQKGVLVYSGPAKELHGSKEMRREFLGVG